MLISKLTLPVKGMCLFLHTLSSIPFVVKYYAKNFIKIKPFVLYVKLKNHIFCQIHNGEVNMPNLL